MCKQLVWQQGLSSLSRSNIDALDHFLKHGLWNLLANQSQIWRLHWNGEWHLIQGLRNIFKMANMPIHVYGKNFLNYYSPEPEVW